MEKVYKKEVFLNTNHSFCNGLIGVRSLYRSTHEARREVKYQPVFPGIQPITFNVPASDNYINLKEIKLEVQVRLTDPANAAAYTGIEVQATRQISDATVTHNCAIVNNFVHTIFKQIMSSTMAS